MEITLAEQTIVFLKSFIFGMVLGAFYDLFRGIRLVKNKNLLVIFICDILYFIVCGILTFIFILYVNYGLIRGYIIIGAFLGAVFYYNTIGAVMIKIMDFLIRLIRRIIRPFVKVIYIPIRKLFRLLVKLLTKFKKIKVKRSKINEDSTKKGLKLPVKLVYNIKKHADKKVKGKGKESYYENSQEKKEKHSN